MVGTTSQQSLPISPSRTYCYPTWSTTIGNLIRLQKPVGAQSFISPSPLSPCLKESKGNGHVSARERHGDEESEKSFRWLCHEHGARKPVAYCPTSDDFLFFFTALCFSILGTSRFNITVPRRSQYDVTVIYYFHPPRDFPHPIFEAKYPVFRSYPIMWQQNIWSSKRWLHVYATLQSFTILFKYG